MSIYLDNAATTPLDLEVIDLIQDLNTNLFANPSSIHSLGVQARKQLEAARESIAASINAEPQEIIFMSGATEANNTVMATLDYDLIITSPAEHASVIEPAKASCKDIIWLNLDQEGFINLTELEDHLRNNDSKKILVSLMHGNNEIGTLEDIEAIGALCSKFNNVVLHSDCVQTFTKHKIDVKQFGLDFISSSAHKLHGPKGVGFLYSNSKLDTSWFKSQSLIMGGGHEFDRRSGTENLISIIAYAKAVEVATKSDHQAYIELYKSFVERLKQIPGVVINGPQDLDRRLIGNINFSLTAARLMSEELVLQLDLAGVCTSSGSACSSKRQDSDEPGIVSSYVLRACRIDDHIAKKAIRISMSRFNTQAELDQAIKIITEIAERFRDKVQV